MTDKLAEAVERVERALLAAKTDGFTPEIEQVFIDYLPTILSSLKGDEEMAERVVGEIERYGEGLVPELRIVCTWLANHFRTDEDARAAISVIGE